jgi:hypothetical protein
MERTTSSPYHGISWGRPGVDFPAIFNSPRYVFDCRNGRTGFSDTIAPLCTIGSSFWRMWRLHKWRTSSWSCLKDTPWTRTWRLSFNHSPSLTSTNFISALLSDRYETFFEANEARLRQLPASDIAVKYYTGEDLYTFDDFQVRHCPPPPPTRRVAVYPVGRSPCRRALDGRRARLSTTCS